MLIFDSGDWKDLDGHEGIISIFDVGVFGFLQALEVELVEVDPCRSPNDLHPFFTLLYAVAALEAHPVILPMDLCDNGLQLALRQLIYAY